MTSCVHHCVHMAGWMDDVIDIFAVFGSDGLFEFIPNSQSIPSLLVASLPFPCIRASCDIMYVWPTVYMYV